MMTQTCMISTSTSLMASGTKDTGLVEARILACAINILATAESLEGATNVNRQGSIRKV